MSVVPRAAAACWRSLAELDVRRFPFHLFAACVQWQCNICSATSSLRQVGARRRMNVEIVGIVMLGSIALWFTQQFERHE